jgi:cysteine desulfurase
MTILITVMHVNNEVGSIQPIERIAELKNEAEKRLGRRNCFISTRSNLHAAARNLREPADLVSVSGHKIHGPKEWGALDRKA